VCRDKLWANTGVSSSADDMLCLRVEVRDWYYHFDTESLYELEDSLLSCIKVPLRKFFKLESVFTVFPAESPQEFDCTIEGKNIVLDGLGLLGHLLVLSFEWVIRSVLDSFEEGVDGSFHLVEALLTLSDFVS